MCQKHGTWQHCMHVQILWHRVLWFWCTVLSHTHPAHSSVLLSADTLAPVALPVLGVHGVQCATHRGYLPCVSCCSAMTVLCRLCCAFKVQSAVRWCRRYLRHCSASVDVIALVTSGLGLSLFVFRMACLELGHHMYRCASAHVLLPMREHTRTWPLSLLLV